MSQRTSLFSKALKGAQLASHADAQDFWDRPIGKAKRVREEYIKYSTQLPVNKKVIFYEAMSGERMGDNPYGIFEYLSSNPKYGNYLHVWSIAANGVVPDRHKDSPNVAFARRGTHSYAYFLACAGHLICNANLPGYFTRRPRQRYLNTWHGIPYKALGRQAPKARYGAPSGPGTFLKATHILTPCGFMTDKVLSAYSMAGVSTAEIAETGYPRVDLTVNLDHDSQSRLRHLLDVDRPRESVGYRPTVLYAPTWRSDGGEDVVNTEHLVNDLKALAKLDIQLIYRGHHRMHRLIQDATVGDQIGNVIIPPHDISSNELLTVVDILITDYSSIFFDFLPTGRPVVHYLYDLDEYKRTRGLNLEVEDLPGSVAFTQRDLLGAVTEASTALREALEAGGLARDLAQGEKYKRAQHRFCPHEDGSSSKRAVEFFLKGKTKNIRIRRPRDGRPTAAFWAGSLTVDSENEGFMQSLVDSAHSAFEQTVFIIDRETPTDKNVLKQIHELGDNVSSVPYNVGPSTLLPTEESDYKSFVAATFRNFDEVKAVIQENSVLSGVFAYEYRRRLDDAQFDRVVIPPGLSNHESALATFADRRTTLPSGKRVVPVNKNTAPDSQPSSFMRNAANIALPKGTPQRRFVSRIYRKIRNTVQSK